MDAGASQMLGVPKVWKLREEQAKRGPRWPSFNAFCRAELGMTPKNAYSLSDVSKNFTEEQANHWGTSKLGLLLTARPFSFPSRTQLLSPFTSTSRGKYSRSRCRSVGALIKRSSARHPAVDVCAVRERGCEWTAGRQQIQREMRARYINARQ